MEHSPTQWRAKLLMSEADPCVTCTAKECGENITPDLRGQRPADPGSALSHRGRQKGKHEISNTRSHRGQQKWIQEPVWFLFTLGTARCEQEPLHCPFIQVLAERET